MAVPRKTRGEYRPIYEALVDGPDFRRLSGVAKLALLTIKIKSGAAGLRPWPALAEQLSDMTGFPCAQMKRAIAELIKAQWIQYEDSMVWLVRGLAFEPQLTPGNAVHRKWLAGVIEALPRGPIIDRFRVHYGAWFPGEGSERVARGSSTESPESGESLCLSSPLPLPLPLPVNSSCTPTDDGPHRQRLAKAANDGIAVLWTPQPHPLRWDSPGAFQLAETLAAADVPIEFAVQCVFALGKSRRPSNGAPPKTLKYFADATVEAWRLEQQASAVSAAPFGEEVDPLKRTALLAAAEGDAEWQAYCREKGYVWRVAA